MRSAASTQRPRSIASSASSDSLSTMESALPSARPRRRRTPRRGRTPGRRRRRAGAPRADKHERRVAPRAPGWFLRPLRAPASVSHLLGTGGTHERPQHGPRRVERRRAVHRDLVERRRVEERRPPLRLGGLPGQRRDPAGQHGQRGVAPRSLGRRGSESHRCTVDMLAGLVGRQDQLRSPAGRTGPVRWCSAGARAPSAGEPLASYQSAARRCSFVDDVGLDAAKLAEQELPEQGVVAVPLPPAIQRDQERVRRLEARAAASCAPDSSRTASHSGAQS